MKATTAAAARRSVAPRHRRHRRRHRRCSRPPPTFLPCNVLHHYQRSSCHRCRHAELGVDGRPGPSLRVA
nr:hypothetical protein [Tawny frogmouth aviadenovirus A]